jgi:hypothetical protein
MLLTSSTPRTSAPPLRCGWSNAYQFTSAGIRPSIGTSRGSEVVALKTRHRRIYGDRR